VNAADCPEGADTFVAMAEMVWLAFSHSFHFTYPIPTINQLETVGREEGCPAQAPANLQVLAEEEGGVGWIFTKQNIINVKYPLKFINNVKNI
jgi:hypothetical protein